LKFEPGDIGARLLESITRGLYDGNLNCIREYVQNCIDSKAKKIEVVLENGNENLVIKDDAAGMDKIGIKSALRLGWSDKTEEDIGWRGIGIWSGVSVCKKLVIITKSQNGGKYVVEIDCDKLKKEIEKNKDIFEVLTAITSEIEEESLGKSEGNQHFTEIRLEKILPQLRTVFNQDDIKKFLENTVPAPFNEEFYQGKEIEKWLNEKGVKMPQSEIFFQNERIFRPPRKSIETFSNFISKEFIVKGDLIAVAWFVTTKNNKIISEDNGGIVFKKKGFTIGDTNLVIKLHNKSYNKWQIGEIHIVTKEIRENSPRNNFESSDNLEEFLHDVGDFIGQLSSQNRYQSSKIFTDFTIKASKLIDSGKIDEAKEVVKKAKGRLQSSRSFPEDPSLCSMKKQIDEQSDIDKQNLEILSEKIATAKKVDSKGKDALAIAKEQYESYCKGTSDDFQDYEKKFSSHGKLDFDISITRPLITLLQEKTELSSNEIIELSKVAYGWTAVNHSVDMPLLTVDAQLNDKKISNSERKRILNRNTDFGVMIYAVHDLLVNLEKHKRGQSALNWFENAPDVEKYKMLLEIKATLHFIHRLIKQSEKYQS
jgi:hypothetical protein